MRCVPQVHGIVNDTIKFVEGVLTTEMNSALDNPVSWKYFLSLSLSLFLSRIHTHTHTHTHKAYMVPSSCVVVYELCIQQIAFLFHVNNCPLNSPTYSFFVCARKYNVMIILLSSTHSTYHTLYCCGSVFL